MSTVKFYVSRDYHKDSVILTVEAPEYQKFIMGDVSVKVDVGPDWSTEFVTKIIPARTSSYAILMDVLVSEVVSSYGITAKHDEDVLMLHAIRIWRQMLRADKNKYPFVVELFDEYSDTFKKHSVSNLSEAPQPVIKNECETFKIANPPENNYGVEALAKQLPGYNERVLHPPKAHEDDYCKDFTFADYVAKEIPVRISALVMHLNDNHRWTREQIADWLETLDVDLSFKIKENEE